MNDERKKNVDQKPTLKELEATAKRMYLKRNSNDFLINNSFSVQAAIRVTEALSNIANMPVGDNQRVARVLTDKLVFANPGNILAIDRYLESMLLAFKLLQENMSIMLPVMVDYAYSQEASELSTEELNEELFRIMLVMSGILSCEEVEDSNPVNNEEKTGSNLGEVNEH